MLLGTQPQVSRRNVRCDFGGHAIGVCHGSIGLFISADYKQGEGNKDQSRLTIRRMAILCLHYHWWWRVSNRRFRPGKLTYSLGKDESRDSRALPCSRM